MSRDIEWGSGEYQKMVSATINSMFASTHPGLARSIKPGPLCTDGNGLIRTAIFLYI